MAQKYKVVDCRSAVIDPIEIEVVADTPEHAARLALGEELVRGSRQVHMLRARVYSGGTGALTMVRLYAKAEPKPAIPHQATQNAHWTD